MAHDTSVAPPPEASSPGQPSPSSSDCWLIRGLCVLLIGCLAVAVAIVFVGGLMVSLLVLGANLLLDLLVAWRSNRPRLRGKPHPRSRWS